MKPILGIDPGAVCTALALGGGWIRRAGKVEILDYRSVRFSKRKGESGAAFNLRRRGELEAFIHRAFSDYAELDGLAVPKVVLIEYPGQFSFARSAKRNHAALQINHSFADLCSDVVRRLSIAQEKVEGHEWKGRGRGRLRRDLKAYVRECWGLEVNEHEADAIMMVDWFANLKRLEAMQARTGQ